MRAVYTERALRKEIESRLEAGKEEEGAITKLLVLGPREAGKSNVFKQIQILFSVTDPPARFIMACRANLFRCAHAVHGGMMVLNMKYGSAEGEEAARKIIALPDDGGADVTSELPGLFATMYKDTGVQEAIERAAECQLKGSTSDFWCQLERYFWERAEDILKSDYLPTEQDMLRAYVRTTGIVQQNFRIGERRCTVFPSGWLGQTGWRPQVFRLSPLSSSKL